MNSDDWFEDLDAVALEEIDGLEAAALAEVDNPSRPGQSVLNNGLAQPASVGDSFDLSFDIDEVELQQLDRHVNALWENNRRPVLTRVNSTNSTRQTTLEGSFVASPRKSPGSGSQLQKAKPTSNNLFGQKAPKTKKWDHTEFAKTGTKPSKKTKRKNKFVDPDGWDEDEDMEFDQFPAPFIPRLNGSETKRHSPPPPMKLVPDLLEAKHWLYPLNKPKRDYQFNIVRRCLFDNTLVSLPTGLGKTFIAGSVMLNYYRWFPEGKVVFVAPTKPLVAQQIHACHKVCGIPGSDAVLLTGAVQKHFRAKHWNEKRVFYMTPQTLRNDLYESTCDAMDIILLVIDEAHRATGGYAYNEVVRFLMAKNPHFRVLALTATPGSTPEAVQNLIDGLHISHVEIRDENSIDIRQYLHEKRIEQHVISMNDEINRVKDLLVKVMNPLMQKLQQSGILFGGDPVKMHSFLPQAKRLSLLTHQRWASLPLTKLSTLARAMGYLLEGTISMCHTFLHGLIGDEDVPAMLDGDESDICKRKKKTTPKQSVSKIKWRNDANFMAVMGELESQRSHGFRMHPKMEMLKELLVKYFEQRKSEDETKEGGPSKAMIFVTYRDIVDDIVKILDECRPIIRPSKFVGQGSDKQGGRGMSQKRQLEIIRQFQSNEYNVLVATSVGEEGLDIGEVDFIVCYDAQKTPIRMLQRLGRTGRQRDGIVHILLAEHREEFNMEKAKKSYKEVQKTIWRGDQLELYADVERLIPQHVKPECVEKVMEITPYVPEQPYNKKAEDDKLKLNKAKRKRKDDIGRNIPLGASTGFVRASELTVKGTKKRKKKTSEPIKEEKAFDQQGIDDDTDIDIESGVIMSKPRRTKSSTATSSKSKALKQMKLRKYPTLDNKSQRKRAMKAKEKDEDPTSSLFSQLGKDELDDMDVEQTISLSSSPRRNKWEVVDNGPAATASSKSSLKTTQNRSLTPSFTGAIIDLSNLDSDTEVKENTKPPPYQNDLSWLVEHDDEMSIRIASSSPVVERREPGPSHVTFDAKQPVQSMDPSDWSPKARRGKTKVEESIISIHDTSSSPLYDAKGKRKARWTDMPPPDLPQFLACQSPDVPAATFPVKQAGKARAIPLAIDGYSSPMEKPLKRLHQHPSTSTPVQKKRKGKLTVFGAQDNPLFDVVADHSGDEVSEGASGSEDDMESETDKMFIKNSPLTQVSSSYDQSLIYRQSLLTQAPSNIDMPKFGNGPARPNLFGPRRVVRPIEPSSSPAKGGSDDYEFGSFVVPDDTVE